MSDFDEWYAKQNVTYPEFEDIWDAGYKAGAESVLSRLPDDCDHEFLKAASGVKFVGFDVEYTHDETDEWWRCKDWLSKRLRGFDDPTAQ